MCKCFCSRPNRKIGGPNKIIEVDENLFTRRKSIVGRVLPPQWVLGGLCRETRGCFFTPIPDRTAETLMATIENNVADGSIIYTDCWRGGKTDELRDTGYDHFTVNHKYSVGHRCHIRPYWRDFFLTPTSYTQRVLNWLQSVVI